MQAVAAGAGGVDMGDYFLPAEFKKAEKGNDPPPAHCPKTLNMLCALAVEDEKASFPWYSSMDGAKSLPFGGNLLIGTLVCDAGATFLIPRLDKKGRLCYNGPMLCFYFAYGSNMNWPHLQDVLASHGVDTEGLGDPHPVILQGYRLRTNYVSTTHGAGVCNIEPAQEELVEGLLVKISPAIQEVLRIKEGWPSRYEEVTVDVLVGDHRKPIRALTYIVAADYRLDMDMPVTARYRRLVLDGARTAGLSKSYQQQLVRLLRSAEELAVETPIEY